MHLSILCPTTPSRAISGKRDEDLNYAKFKCTTYWTCQSVKSQPSLHLKDGDLQGELLVNVHTSVHVYDEQSNSPCIGQALVSNQSKMLHLSPYIALEGVMGHNIDRCITSSTPVNSLVATIRILILLELFVVKNFYCFTSLPSFSKNLFNNICIYAMFKHVTEKIYKKLIQLHSNPHNFFTVNIQYYGFN